MEEIHSLYKKDLSYPSTVYQILWFLLV